MEYSGFFNGNHRYGEEEFNRYFENIYESGVGFDEKDNNAMAMKVSAKNGSVSVESGFAIIKGYYLYNDAVKVLQVEKPATGTRYDRVVVRLDANVGQSSINIKIKSGNNVKPPELERQGNIYELSLASVAIDSTGNLFVQDERYNTKLCGNIRPKNISSYKTMIEGFEEKFNTWINGMQNKTRDVFVQNTVPSESVSGSIWIDTSVQ